MNNILLLGSSGLIGTCLCKNLLNMGYCIDAAGRKKIVIRILILLNGIYSAATLVGQASSFLSIKRLSFQRGPAAERKKEIMKI